MRRGAKVFSLDPIAAVVARAAVSGAAVLRNWRTASPLPVGLAPASAAIHEAVVRVYSARCQGWRGYFGVHTWIEVKPVGERTCTIYEVTCWRLRRRGCAVAIRKRAPDEQRVESGLGLLAEKRGQCVSALIEHIDKAARDYPYAEKYVVWPGPNSNTFTAHLARMVPELELDLPATAIGKDYLGGRLWAPAPSGSGFQVSLFGLLGVLVSRVEGFEVNLLGLTFGFDPFHLAFKLPLIGRLGAARRLAIQSSAAASPSSTG